MEWTKRQAELYLESLCYQERWTRMCEQTGEKIWFMTEVFSFPAIEHKIRTAQSQYARHTVLREFAGIEALCRIFLVGWCK